MDTVKPTVRGNPTVTVSEPRQKVKPTTLTGRISGQFATIDARTSSNPV